MKEKKGGKDTGQQVRHMMIKEKGTTKNMEYHEERKIEEGVIEVGMVGGIDSKLSFVHEFAVVPSSSEGVSGTYLGHFCIRSSRSTEIGIVIRKSVIHNITYSERTGT